MLESIDYVVLTFFCITMFVVLVWNYLFKTQLHICMLKKYKLSTHIFVFFWFNPVFYFCFMLFFFVFITIFSVMWNQIKIGVCLLILVLLSCFYFFLKNATYIHTSKEMTYSKTYFMFIVKMHCIIASSVNSLRQLCKESLQTEENWRFLVSDIL